VTRTEEPDAAVPAITAPAGAVAVVVDGNETCRPAKPTAWRPPKRSGMWLAVEPAGSVGTAENGRRYVGTGHAVGPGTDRW